MASFHSVRQRLAKKNAAAYEAAALGLDIFELASKTPESDYQKLKSEFFAALAKWDLSDLVDHQIGYAIRLATDSSDLLYEEMHKLFSLLNEIHALQEIGLTVSDNLQKQLCDSVLGRFRRQRPMSALVANDRAEAWCRSLWWYDGSLRDN
jgi:hypothetical protein